MLLAAILLTSLAPQAPEVVLHPQQMLDPQGRLSEGRYLTVQDGRIRAISATAPGRATVLELEGVLAPGMVDAFTTDGAAGRITEEAARLTPALRAADAADLDLPLWRKLAAGGVTAAHLVPEPSNVLAGFGALIATQGSPRLATPATVQVVSLLSWIEDARVGPTALAGGLELLGQALAAKDPALKGAGMLIFVENAEGIRGARALCDRAGVKQRHFALFGDAGAYGGEAAQELVGLPAIGAGGGRARATEVLQRLHGAGVRVAFGTLGGVGGPEALRQAAMLYARATGDPELAWAAVSSHAAELLGQSGRFGVIAEGARADLVLWTGHPLDAAARVQAVMIGGNLIQAAAPQER